MRPVLRQLGLVLALVTVMTASAHAASRFYTLSIEGLVCPLCAFSVKRNLTAIEGVHEVQIDYRTGKALVTMAEGATLVETEARAAIESAGFELRSFEEVHNTPRR